jgi:hypothetical protein
MTLGQAYACAHTNANIRQKDSLGGWKLSKCPNGLWKS